MQRNNVPPRFWYKNAVIYELHVRSFLDSNGDGIGDFPGLTQKLDYLQDLGVTALWLLPFYPSPLKDDGYDIADYFSINPIYGTLDDFKEFLAQAHERGLQVITELVVNHTSDQHPWFQFSRRAPPGSPWRDFYVWNDSPEKFRDARIIFRDFEPSNWSWDHVAQRYYWHRFYSHQPDLNFDHPEVHAKMQEALDFWFDLGVDGVRLDAVPYLYEREGTSCENLPETHAFLKKLRRHVDEKYGDRMLLAEANQWPEDAVSYFGAGAGDECHMAFHFPLMPRLFMAVRMEDRVPIHDIIEQTPPIPETAQWALFLRNHDELTLEMVTDEERDYMYRVYAHDKKARINLGIRRRLAPLLENDRKKIELLNLLLLSLPGTPVLYYGDEIGMGDNIFLGDRNAVRTPMQWSSDKNAGFSRAHPHALYLPIILDPEYHYESINVEAQQHNSNSLLWWMKRAIRLRKRLNAFGQGSIQFLNPENRKILAFLRRYETEQILIVANLSRFPQPVQLDLGNFKGLVPIELFGRTEFPAIDGQPYALTLSPHAAFWFSLEVPRTDETTASLTPSSPAFVAVRTWEDLFEEWEQSKLETVLTPFIRRRRWFAGKGRVVKSAYFRDVIPIVLDSEDVCLAVVTVDYVQAEPEDYLLPVAFADGPRAEDVQQRSPHSIIAALELSGRELRGILYDATVNPRFSAALLQVVGHNQRIQGRAGSLLGALFPGQEADLAVNISETEISPATGEQSNTSVMFGDRLLLKLFRRFEPGSNPDLELARFLTGKAFANTPQFRGGLEYLSETNETFTIGMLTSIVPNSKDAWVYTLDSLTRFFERVQSSDEGLAQPLGDAPALLLESEIPAGISALLGAYVESARLLGRRTAELHRVLASDSDNKDFAPEPFTPFYQRSLYQSMRNLVIHNLDLLDRCRRQLPPDLQKEAEQVCAMRMEILHRLRAIHEQRINAFRIRCHGDYHLGQVLYTGKDFFIIDFEGEPARSIGERRIKRSPLRDVAGMIRSFHYASQAAILEQIELGNQPDSLAKLRPWVQFWHRWISSIFFTAYHESIRSSGLLPTNQGELSVLLYCHLLEKALYELGYELNNRPNWIKIPLEGVLKLLESLPREIPSQ